MDWYFGTKQQIALQQKTDELATWCATTNGALSSGRFFGTDDPEQLTWDVILERLDQDGVFTFRMIAIDMIPSIKAKLATHGFRIDFWNVFSGNAETVTKQVTPVINTALPKGYSVVEDTELTSPIVINEIQKCMSRNGVVPVSGKLLSGSTMPAAMIAIRDQNEAIVATALGYLPYNKYSRWASTAWGGLVAVDESQRGQKLGTKVNALMTLACIDKLGARYVQEYAAETNIPSRRMIERCGMTLDRSVMSGIATSGAERFTK